ncbi:phosphatases II [Cystobasidium minutum MCA 4210]|uniref:phosphatases II n=1 Tax=Cystobasidium minutum MCA 4210 TaxID=1397322 RepID=UPI0034CD658B|eukprot:jgi/Rhomi1/151075/estExt_Genewise1.C_3_t10319
MASTSTAHHASPTGQHHHLSVADLHSEDIDSDSIMTDDIEDDAASITGATLHSGTIDPSTLLYTASTSTSGSPIASTSGTSGLASQGASASTSGGAPSTAKAARVVSTSTTTANIRPSGPVCEFGERLGYTYFSKPVPTAEELNTAHKHTETFWLTVDNDLTYLSFFRDTGPLNVACLYRFCLHLHDLLENPALRTKRIILFSSDDPDKKANAALLMSLYAMIVLRWSPADALHPVACLELQPFRDAGYARADFHLSLQDIIFGARKAIDHRLLKLDEFNLSEYEYYEKVENGDWNFITPHFLAFASPVESGFEESSSSSHLSPAGSPKGKGTPAKKINKAFRNVLDYFQNNNVKMVVRLNKKLYDERRFIERGMEHREMYFDDGTNPTMEMVRDFIDLSERVIRDGGVVAVHCKAGLGRTGTLIGAYLIYKYGFTATEAVGFMRLMRPGTCVGPQQHYMYENQMTWVKWGAIDRYKAENPAVLLSEVERPITPPTDDEKEESLSAKDGSLPPPSGKVNASRLATPRAVTPLLTHPTTVPGQPRKTPGAKTRHAVAAPETVDVLHDDVFVDQMETQAAQKRLAKASKERERTASVSVASVAGSHHGSASRASHSPRGLGRDVSATPSAAERDEEMLMDDSTQTSHASPKSHKTKTGDLLLVTEDIKPSKDQLEDFMPTQTNLTEAALQELTPSNSLDGNGQPLSVTITSAVINAAHNRSKTPTTASRIAKPRGQQRPLTTIHDNRQLDKLAPIEFNDENTNHAAPAALPGNPAPRARGRSASGTISTTAAGATGKGGNKRAAGLGSVYEDGANAGNISSSSSSSGERYNLRAARSKEALSTHFHSHASAANGRHGTATPPPMLPTSTRPTTYPTATSTLHPQPPNSPSRLPQRVAGRRKAAVASAAKTAGHLGVPANEGAAQRHTGPTATAPITNRLGRNTRRRRSVEQA